MGETFPNNVNILLHLLTDKPFDERKYIYGKKKDIYVMPEEIQFTLYEAALIHQYINSYQFELDYSDEEERMNVLKRVMVTTSMTGLPIKFKKYLGEYEKSISPS